MADCMDQRSIPYTLEIVQIGHLLPPSPVNEHIIPFCEENLIFE